jgi:hypothetical protein
LQECRRQVSDFNTASARWEQTIRLQRFEVGDETFVTKIVVLIENSKLGRFQGQEAYIHDGEVFFNLRRAEVDGVVVERIVGELTRGETSQSEEVEKDEHK